MSASRSAVRETEGADGPLPSQRPARRDPDSESPTRTRRKQLGGQAHGNGTVEAMLEACNKPVKYLDCPTY